MANILIEAVEVLGYTHSTIQGNKVSCYINDEEAGYMNFRFSPADIAEALRLKIVETVLFSGLFVDRLRRTWRKADTMFVFEYWLVNIATPIQKIEAALKALKGD